MSNDQKVATRVVTGPCRLFYLNVLKPKANDQGKLKFSTMVLIKKDDKDTLKRIHAAIEAAKRTYETKFNGGARISDEDWRQLHTPMRDGDKECAIDPKKDKDLQGHYFFNASSDNKPGLVDKNVDAIIDGAQVYSGMFGRVDVNFYPFNTKKKGIAAGLNHIQKIRDGEPKIGAGAPEAAFDRYEDNRDEDGDVAF